MDAAPVGASALSLTDWVQTIGIVASLLLASFTIWNGNRAQKVSNLFKLTEMRRSIWLSAAGMKSGGSMIDPMRDLSADPITAEERLIAVELVLHVHNAFDGRRLKGLPDIDGFDTEVGEMFQLPVLKAIWKEIGPIQNVAFREYVESCIHEEVMEPQAGTPLGRRLAARRALRHKNREP